MKTVTGKVTSSEPISLFKATKLLSGFVSSDNGASQAVTAYLRRASTAFNELKNLHKEIRSTKLGSEVRHEQSPSVLGRDKESDDLVETEIKEDKSKKKNKEETVVEDKLEDEQERKEKKKKKKRKSDGEVGSEERKSKKKRKS